MTPKDSKFASKPEKLDIRSSVSSNFISIPQVKLISKLLFKMQVNYQLTSKTTSKLNLKPLLVRSTTMKVYINL